ncbi:MAG TPA: helix-turn-helix transcriptional regulator [Ktedonobacterales bacterium]|nr:helix-turn-helix transcriptional regulator [Ktedonobacterales bacterium]
MSLKFGILGLLTEESLHGYEVKQRFEAMLGGTWEVNIGQVYSTLQRVERDGFVETVGERGDRGKQAYQLTTEGRRALEEWLAQPEAEPQELRQELFVKLLLIRRLANGNLPSLLLRQRRVYLQRLRDLTELERRIRREGRDDLALLVTGAVLHTEADLKWLDAYIEEAGKLGPYHLQQTQEGNTT